MLFILPFFFPLFLGGKRKGENNKQSRDFKSCLSAGSFLIYFHLTNWFFLWSVQNSHEKKEKWQYIFVTFPDIIFDLQTHPFFPFFLLWPLPLFSCHTTGDRLWWWKPNGSPKKSCLKSFFCFYFSFLFLGGN